MQSYDAKLRCKVTMQSYDAKLRCKVTMQSYDAKLRCKVTMQSYDAKLRCKVTMQSYDAKLLRCKVQIKLCIVTLHLCNYASSLVFLNLSIIDLFIRKWYLNVKYSVPDVILKVEDFMTIIYGIKLTLF